MLMNACMHLWLRTDILSIGMGCDCNVHYVYLRHYLCACVASMFAFAATIVRPNAYVPVHPSVLSTYTHKTNSMTWDG